jgi:hypothetical protein
MRGEPPFGGPRAISTVETSRLGLYTCAPQTRLRQDSTAMALGPQQMPPQGAKALVGELLRGRRNGPEVSAVLDESESGSPSMEFLNEGSGTAVRLQYIAESANGELAAHTLGDLAPGATLRSRLRGDVDPTRPFRFAWSCQDFKGRARAWSYDGRSKRLRGGNAATAEAAFRALYR